VYNRPGGEINMNDKFVESLSDEFFDNLPDEDLTRLTSVSLEGLEGQELLTAMELRALQTLAKCVPILCRAYPDFEMNIKVTLKDKLHRVDHQTIEVNSSANVGR
jgi:hypothetical protein